MDGDYYGAPSSANDNKSLGERLRELYSAEDFVTVMNIDTEPVVYQFIKPSDIETFSDYPGHKDTVMHNTPKRYRLMPGETKLVTAYEADKVIDTLIKQISQRNTQDKIAMGELVSTQSANWNDPTTRDSMISKIFLGKKDVLGQYNQAPEINVEEDLTSESPRPAAVVRAEKAKD